MIRRALAVCWLVVIASPALAAPAPRRVALVIGNADYKHIEDLPAAANDMRDIEYELDALQFTIVRAPDATEAVLRTKIAQFREALGTEDAEAVVYYSGHGANVLQGNYLVPVDMPRGAPEEFTKHAVPTSEIYKALREARARIGVVLLDACRKSVIHDQTIVKSGLEKPVGDDATSRIVTGFADQPGASISDTVDGRNSAYAKAILQHIGSPGLTLEDFFIAVGNTVEGFRTGQVPWQSSAQRAQFFFRQPVYLEVWGDAADDDLIVTAGGDTYIRSVDGRSKRMRLLPGRNLVTVAVVNFRSKSGGDLLPEGWSYALRTNIVDGPAGPRFSGEEPERPVPRSRWGRTFVVARMAVIVGRHWVRFEDDPEDTVWLDGFSALPSPDDDVYDAARWAVLFRGVPLFDNDTEETKRDLAVIRENVARAHNQAADAAARFGISHGRHRDVSNLIASTDDAELEEALRRVRNSISPAVIGEHLLAACSGPQRSVCNAYRRQNQWQALRAHYFERQQHAIDARELLSILSNRELRELTAELFGQ